MNPMKLRRPVVLTLGLALLAALTCSAAPPDLEGDWVMLQVYPRIADLPLVGESTQTSYVVQRVEIEQDGLSLVMFDRYCFTVIEESSPLAKTEIPDAFMRSLRPSPRTATLHEKEGEFILVQPPYIELRGTLLDNPASDELPLDPEDPRVIDQDEDGFPGMTVNVTLLGLMQAQIYVAQRVQYQLRGVVTSMDRIEGLIGWTDEQVILAATSPLLMAGAESVADPDPTKHLFVMLRTQEQWTCEWLRENWRALFDVEGATQE
jgi:hypothetical protein